jgi:eukaryotic-like serine/threonine-protein kinase
VLAWRGRAGVAVDAPERIGAARVLGGRYRLGSRLGRGGVGEVYEAVQLSDGERVAVKVLHRRSSTKELRREVAIVERLPAHRVPRVLDIESDGDATYVVMELLEGEDLGARIRRRSRLAPAEAVAILDQLAEVLDVAHEAGVVHRDVKPENVFLVGGEDVIDVRLLDFGVARTARSNTTQSVGRTGYVLGTPGYLAPEQVAEGRGPVGPATDVFALGALVYRALTGHPAFPARQPAAAIYEALNRHPPPPSSFVGGLSADIDAVVALSLAKDPKARFSRASELAAQLRAAVDGELDSTVRERAAALEAARRAPDRTITAA